MRPLFVNFVNIVCGVLCIFASFVVYSQSEEQIQDTILEEADIVSVKAAAMGGALGSLASDVDALYYNPAFIKCDNSSYLQDQLGKENSKLICNFNFIYVGMGLNQNSYNLIRDFKKTGAFSNSALAEAILDAYGGKRQFARVFIFPNIFIKNFIVGPVIDQQVAGVALGRESGAVRLKYHQKTGLFAGVSFFNIDNKLFGGATVSYANLKVLKGDYEYSTIDSYQEILSQLNKSSQSYTGFATHAGISLKTSVKPLTFLSLIVKNLGNTKYRSSDTDNYIKEQNITLSFATRLNISDASLLSFIFDTEKLEDTELSVEKKFKGGVEFVLVPPNMRLLGSINIGYNYTGLSYGGTLSLGMLGIEYASYTENVGYKNNKVLERRSSCLLHINLVK